MKLKTLKLEVRGVEEKMSKKRVIHICLCVWKIKKAHG